MNEGGEKVESNLEKASNISNYSMSGQLSRENLNAQTEEDIIISHAKHKCGSDEGEHKYFYGNPEEMMEEIMDWFLKNGIREGHPNEIVEDITDQRREKIRIHLKKQPSLKECELERSPMYLKRRVSMLGNMI